MRFRVHVAVAVSCVALLLALPAVAGQTVEQDAVIDNVGQDNGAQTAEAILDVLVRSMTRPTAQPLLPTSSCDPDPGFPAGAVVAAPAASAAAVGAGVMVTAVSGVESVDSGRPINPQDGFVIGSLTKPMVATIILQLQEEGVVTLEDTISDWVPEVAAAVPFGEEITIRQLLSHLAGLPDYPAAFTCRVLVDPDFLRVHFEPADIIGLAASLIPRSPELRPGNDTAYSSTNFIVLGMIIQAATGQVDLAPVFQERIFAPLGMNRTTFESGRTIPDDRVVSGYYAYPLDNRTFDGADPSSAWAAGAVTSTASDILLFLQGLFKGQLFQDPGSLQLMTELQLAQGELVERLGIPGGYGLGVAEFFPGAFGHVGLVPGYRSIMVYHAGLDVGLVLLTSSSNNAAYIDGQLAFVDLLKAMPTSCGDGPGAELVCDTYQATIMALAEAFGYTR